MFEQENSSNDNDATSLLPTGDNLYEEMLNLQSKFNALRRKAALEEMNRLHLNYTEAELVVDKRLAIMDLPTPF